MVDEEEMDDEDEDSEPSNKYDKTNWSKTNTGIFCELAVEQMRLGNCPSGKMNTRGYKEMVQKFKERTNLNHAPKQFRNRWTQCKKLYTFYKFTMSQSGLGRKPNGAIRALEKWWKKTLRYSGFLKKFQLDSSECMKFSKFIPHYIDELHEMYHNVVVDGTSSTIAGDVNEEEEYEEEDELEAEEDGNDVDASPLSNSSRKRSSSTKDTTSKGEDNEIEQSLKLARECGATDGTEEFFMAIELFATRYNRTVFANINKNEARLTWLKMKCIGNKSSY
ncbi:L10-interacting MYB domain-containing protein-like [Setaria viridis]|uniref:L10-interacting MYB domain-containing protein-like n=1 Tax=Setaria viridis TaxID=4556 RepID=UPI001493CCCF|nr:uncharacterized protein LOC117834345 [Setaria viridis]